MPENKLWFDRVFQSLGLGIMAGSVVVGCGGFILLLLLVSFLGGVASYFISTGIVFFIPVVLLVTVLANYGSVFIARRLEELGEYARSMSSEGTTADFSNLYRVKYAIITTIIILSIIEPLYMFSVLPQSFSILTKLGISLPFLYWNFSIDTFFWVWGYSLYVVYLMGKRPVKLKPFTEDSALGLRPFGRVALLLSAVYYGIWTIILLPSISLGLTSVPLLVFVAAMAILGLWLFLLPLIPLRGKMVRARLEVSNWVGPRYTRALESIKAGEDGLVDEGLARELTSLDKIQRDANQIRTWPFDTNLLIRLAAIILTVVGIVIARIVQLVLHLAT